MLCSVIPRSRYLLSLVLGLGELVCCCLLEEIQFILHRMVIKVSPAAGAGSGKVGLGGPEKWLVIWQIIKRTRHLMNGTLIGNLKLKNEKFQNSRNLDQTSRC